MKTNLTQKTKFRGQSHRGKEDSRVAISSVKGAALNTAALLGALAVCSLPTTGHAQLTPATAVGLGPKATDISSLNPNAAGAPPNAATYFTGQCVWITSTMNTFVAANANYTYTW